MKKLQKTTVWVGCCLVVAGCQTPGMTRPRGFGASEHSGAFAAGASSDSGGSDSGGSSDGSGNSSNDSGNSSDNSANSSNDSANSSDNSKTDSNQSSEDSSKNSTDNSSDSSDSSDSSQKNPAASATVVGLTAAGLGVVFWQVAQHAVRVPPPGAAPPPSPQEVSRAAQTYLRSRTHQLREDLALGAGPTVEELAAMARIRREHLGVFGRLLRSHRQELLALADVRALTSERALEWMQRVGELARTDPRLEEDRRAFLAAYEGRETSP